MINRRLIATGGVIAGLFALTFIPPLAPTPQEIASMTRILSDPLFLARPEGRIAYDVQGNGPLVVLVPGLGDLRAEYRELAPRLASAGYRVISMDLRGHGQSSTGWTDYTSSAIGSDVIAMIEAEARGPAILVGTSMGAAAVSWAAAERPDLVKSLTLIGPFVRDIPPESLIKDMAMKTMIRLSMAGPWGPSAWGMAYQSFYGKTPADMAEYRAALVANMKEPGRMAALKAMIAASKADAEQRLGEVKAPVQVIMGTVDPDFADPKAEADTVARLLNGTVGMVDGAGHYPHVENPGKVADMIRSFIDTTRETDNGKAGA